MSSSVSPMTGPDWSMLRHQVATIQALVKKRYDAPALDQTLADLPHLQRLLDDNVFDATQTEELSSIGAVFGNVIQRQLTFDWVVAPRGRDREPALQLKTSPALVVYPLRMIREAVAQGDAVDLNRMYRMVKEDVARTKIL